MPPDPGPSTQDTWGGATPPAPGGGAAWSGRRKWVAGGVAAVIVVGGGAGIWAASSSSSTDASGATGGGPGSGQFGGRGAPGGAATLSTALHGEFVTAGTSGGYVTEFLQKGKVTALSATSLTAQSADGFTKVYTIDATTATGVTNGEEVTIVATTSGSTATATSITETSATGGPGN
ncbi:hypothetical protein [Amycolatopsis saalfeldensis]|uniref:DUF5666 domain-containing protein n=1 Tax=Amycolatopsis saalfeldensis TaxID=394193 RepID=A0A1H8Y3G1_9PSEU|nr:hypothetical protein [Amycolatopsis saalfeldensis]SEP46068.1 hypothetical protein SAMN04489732_110173 [Amycolatopsis saalfeldensis]